MQVYAGICARTLALAHARTGDRIAIGAYLGSSAKFDNTIAAFAEAHAVLNEHDHRALQTAVAEGRAEPRSDL